MWFERGRGSFDWYITKYAGTGCELQLYYTFWHACSFVIYLT
jgi:hypothetical protein